MKKRLLIEETHNELGFERLLDRRWVRYGALATGAAVALTRLSGAAAYDGDPASGQYLTYDEGADAPAWIAADDRGKGKGGSDKKGGSGKSGGSGKRVAQPQQAKPQAQAKPQQRAVQQRGESPKSVSAPKQAKPQVQQSFAAKPQSSGRSGGDSPKSPPSPKTPRTNSVVAGQQATNTRDANDADKKVGICHATGSATNPFVFVEVSNNAVKAHEHHHDGADIIGVAGPRDCPAGQEAVAGEQATNTLTNNQAREDTTNPGTNSPLTVSADTAGTQSATTTSPNTTSGDTLAGQQPSTTGGASFSAQSFGGSGSFSASGISGQAPSGTVPITSIQPGQLNERQAQGIAQALNAPGVTAQVVRGLTGQEIATLAQQQAVPQAQLEAVLAERAFAGETAPVNGSMTIERTEEVVQGESARVPFENISASVMPATGAPGAGLIATGLALLGGAGIYLRRMSNRRRL